MVCVKSKQIDEIKAEKQEARQNKQTKEKNTSQEKQTAHIKIIDLNPHILKLH